MEIIHDTTEFQLKKQTAVAIGKFDGLHRGHQELLSHILRQKEEGLLAVVFTFHPSAAVFFGQSSSEELTTRQEKRKLFEKMGIDVLIEFPLNRETAATDPEGFVRKYLAGQMRTSYLAAGEDITFGRKGEGNRKLLEKLSESFGYQFQVIEKMREGSREISSTYVREEVEKGHMETAERLLGRYYSFEGKVEEGRKLGRRLGMPTLNLYPPKEKLLPPKGVYYSAVCTEQGRYPGITNIGRKPTVNDTDMVSVETYLYDFEGDMYGQEIVTELLQFKRSEQKFRDVAELKRQMEADIEAGRSFHGVDRKQPGQVDNSTSPRSRSTKT